MARRSDGGRLLSGPSARAVVPAPALLVLGARHEPGGRPIPILLDEGRIVALGDAALAARGDRGVQVVEADDLLAAPGFIDLQLNGAGGHDLTHDPASVWAVGEAITAYGVTAFLPTVITAPPEVAETARRILLEGPPRGYAGAAALGLHLEGPFLSPDRRGVHEPGSLVLPDPIRAASWSRAGGVWMVTLAPELAGATALAARLVERGVVVAAGHSAATFDEARAGIDAGIRYATHLFNGMPPLAHRDPGLVAALLLDERVTVGLIPDGIHVHPAVIRLVWRLAGPDRVSVVTDAIAALGMPPGRYMLGPRHVEVNGNRAALDGRLAGSVLSLDTALRNLVDFADVTVPDAIGTVTRVPARLLGIEEGRGSIAVGRVADLVLLTERLEVVATIVRGQIVHGAARVG